MISDAAATTIQKIADSKIPMMIFKLFTYSTNYETTLTTVVPLNPYFK